MAFYNADMEASSPEKMPEDLVEFMIIQETGWTLEYVRGMKQNDYNKIALMSQMSQQIKNNREKFKMNASIRSPIL